MNSFSIQSQSLEDWLFYLESIHPKEIELGLDRVKQVGQQLELLAPADKVILVGGTNGKGSTSAFLEQLLLASGKTVGVFSSPHLLRYNERVRINGGELDDDAHVEALRFVEQGRGETQLTYFEFGTLAGLYLMQQAKVDYCIMEVGLGGRLDSTNILDADLAVITTIDLDHQDWLGDTRELVGREKAGIFRPGRLAVCGDQNPPHTLTDHAAALGTKLVCRGVDFDIEDQTTGMDDAEATTWRCRLGDRWLENLPLTRLPMANAATALMAFEQLGLSLSDEQRHRVLATSSLPGRLQEIQQSPRVVLDVAHNPQAGAYLARWISQQPCRKVHAVCAMLGDKDSQSTLAFLTEQVDHWYLADLDCPRGAKSSTLSAQLSNELSIACFDNVVKALECALDHTEEDDLIIVFGSFYTVAGVLTHYS